jgi:hypothetical protein
MFASELTMHSPAKEKRSPDMLMGIYPIERIDLPDETVYIMKREPLEQEWRSAFDSMSGLTQSVAFRSRHDTAQGDVKKPHAGWCVCRRRP